MSTHQWSYIKSDTVSELYEIVSFYESTIHFQLDIVSLFPFINQFFLDMIYSF